MSDDEYNSNDNKNIDLDTFLTKINSKKERRNNSSKQRPVSSIITNKRTIPVKKKLKKLEKIPERRNIIKDEETSNDRKVNNKY